MEIQQILTSKEYRLGFLTFAFIIFAVVLSHHGQNPFKALYLAGTALAILLLIYLIKRPTINNVNEFFKSSAFGYWFVVVGLTVGVLLFMVSYN